MHSCQLGQAPSLVNELLEELAARCPSLLGHSQESRFQRKPMTPTLGAWKDCKAATRIEEC